MSCNKRQQMLLGTRVEMEHKLGRKMAQKIASDHLKEDSCYYKHLLSMEKRYTKKG